MDWTTIERRLCIHRCIIFNLFFSSSSLDFFFSSSDHTTNFSTASQSILSAISQAGPEYCLLPILRRFRADIDFKMSSVTGPSRGTIAYWRDKYVKDKSPDREAATQLAYSLWCEHHQSCQKASYHTLKEAFEPYIRQYVSFYVGDFDAYRKTYPDL